MYIDPIGRRAGFTEITHLGQHRALHRLIKVGIVKDDQRRVATKFHRRFEDLISRRMQQLSANRRGTGEGDDAHARVMQHVIDKRAGTLGRQHIEEACRNAGFFQEGHERQHGQRCFGSGLMITPQPAARAGAILRVPMAAG